MNVVAKRKLYSDIDTSGRHLIHYLQVHSGRTVVHELFQLSGSGLGTVQKINELMSQKEAKKESFLGTKNRNGHSDEKKAYFRPKNRSTKTGSG